MELLYWISFFFVFYAYLGYPLFLYLWGLFFAATSFKSYHPFEPSVSIILPVYNEAKVLERKLENCLALDYPREHLEIHIISDGSTDGTNEIAKKYAEKYKEIQFFELPSQSGKAAALNAGLKKAKNEIIVFSDASIMLAEDSIRNIVDRFQDYSIGCISGEDHIKGSEGEGLYGKYELFLRNQESRIHSIVGASGSFYAQRRELCSPFEEGMAPDFLSVLKTVEKGYRAITEPKATGTMTSLKSIPDEFGRKVRTVLRGMTALFYKKELLNPFRYGIFALELISHKLMRWLVPFFLIILLAANLFLLSNTFYLVILTFQVSFYGLAIGAFYHIGNLPDRFLGRFPLYFTTVNVAILVAWSEYIKGTRQEIWSSTKR